MNKMNFLCAIFVLLIILFVASSVNAATSDALLVDDYYSMIKSAYNDQLDAPNVPPKEHNVNLYDGSYSLSETDLIIPGKNGLDFSITRSFNSFTSSYGYPVLEYDDHVRDEPVMIAFEYETYRKGKKIDNVLVGFTNEEEALENQCFYGRHPKYDEYGNERSTTLYSEDSDCNEYISFFNATKGTDDRYEYRIIKDQHFKFLFKYTDEECLLKTTKDRTKVNFEYGWYLSRPGMEKYLRTTIPITLTEMEIEIYGVFQTLEGKVLCWEGEFYKKNDVLESGKFSFKNAKGYRFEYDDENSDVPFDHPKGFKYNFSIVDETTGVRYYFYFRNGNPQSGNYDLKGIEDRYGNIIQYNISDKDNGINITDTYGNQIKIQAPDGKRLSDYPKNVEVVIGEDEDQRVLLSYNMKTVNNDLTDPDGLFKIDDYYVFTMIKAEDGYNIENSPNKTEYLMRQYMLNGDYTDYEGNIETSAKNMDYYHYSQLMPVEVSYPGGVKRVYSHETQRAKLARLTSQTNVYGDCPYVTSVYDVYEDGTIKNQYQYSYIFMDRGSGSNDYRGYGLWSTYTTVTRQADGQEKVYTFSGDNTTTEPQTRMIKTINTMHGADRRYEQFTYKNLMLSGHTVTDYNGDDKFSTITNIEYDKHKNIIKEEYGDKVIEYTYDVPESLADKTPRYSVMTSKKYNLDADTVVTIRNTLTDDRKSIAYSSVYENNVLMSRVHYTYNDDGTVASESVSLSDGNTILNTYSHEYYSDGTHKVSKTVKNRVDADGNSAPDITTSVKYDFLGNVIETVDGNGNITYNEYDIQGRLLKTTYPDGAITSNSYDILNNTVISTDQRGTQIEYSFNSWGDFTRAYLYKNSNTNISSLSGVLEEQKYDALGRPSVFTQYRDDRNYYKITFEYDGFDRIVSQTLTDKDGKIIRKISNEYTCEGDSLGRTSTRVITRLSDANSTAPSYTEILYDYRGLPLEKNITTDGEETISYKYTYDYIGNMTTYTDPNGAVSSYQYDYAGNQVLFTDAAGYTESNGYDEAGRMIWSQDVEGNRTTYHYDTAGMNIKTVSPFDESGTSTVKMYYDANGNLTSQLTQSNAPGEAVDYTRADYIYDDMNRLVVTALYPDKITPVYTKYVYDKSGNITTVVTGDTQLGSEPYKNINGHTANYSYNNINKVDFYYISDTGNSYSYDRAGNTILKCDGNGNQVSYTYNADGNITSISPGDMLYDAVPSNVSIDYNIFGKPSSKTVDGVTTNYTYDDFGRVVSETCQDIKKNYTYDNNGNMLSVSLLYGKNCVYSADYTYDSLNRITETEAPDVTASFEYSPKGNILSYSMDRFETSYIYNKAGLLTGFHRNNEFSETYTYSYDGNKILTLGEGTGVARSEYAYDGAGRLISETADTFSASYTYDNFGNRTAKHQIKDGIITDTVYKYDYDNRIECQTEVQGDNVCETNYFYYYGGYMQSRIKRYYSKATSDTESIGISMGSDEYADNFKYNILGQLVSADIGGKIATYTYNADGLRDSKTVDGTTTKHIWHNGYICAEIVSNDNMTKTISNFVGPQGIHATYRYIFTEDGDFLETDYLLKNDHGDVVSVVHDDGTAEGYKNPDVYNYEYDAFGDLLTDDTYVENPYRYCGEYQDLCSGLIYLRNRYYDPSIGRFITEDPARDGLNWYVYANNNPLKYIDPSGLRSKEAADKIIKDNATYIISAAEEFGVNPGILAATIYAEQRLNVDWKDDYIDGIVGFYGVDTSIGIGQLRISTAKFIEKEGYMPTLSAKDGGWNIPLIGFVHGTEQMVREKTLENSELNIKYAAGYLKYFQDEWKNVYLDIDGKTDILATLYNLGHEQTSPNSNPKPNDFGKFAKENYSHVRKLLGLE